MNPMIIIGGLQMLSSLYGGSQAAQRSKEAMSMIDDLSRQLQAIGYPPYEAMQLALKTPEVQGILEPIQEQAIEVGKSKFSEIQADQGLLQKQREGLNTFEELAKSGMTAQTEAELNAMRDQVAMDQRAARESILQNMAARGVQSAGQEMAASLQGLQGGANEASRQADRLAAQQEQTRIQARLNAANMAGQMANDDFNRQSTIAGGEDAFTQFAKQLEAGRQMRNVASLNAADQWNLANKQNVHNAGVGISNQEQVHNKQLLRQPYDDQLAKFQIMAGLTGSQAQMRQQQGAQEGQMWAGIGQGIGQIGAPFVSEYAKQQMGHKDYGNAPVNTQSATPYTPAPVGNYFGGNYQMGNMQLPGDPVSNKPSYITPENNDYKADGMSLWNNSSLTKKMGYGIV